MGIALWCDVKDQGHAFDDREAIIVNPGDKALYFCKEHCIPAFVAAFHVARSGGRSGIFLPSLGGSFTITPADSQPAPEGQPGPATQRGTSSDGSTPQNGMPTAGGGAGQGGKAKPPRGDRTRESARAIAGLLEAEKRPGSGVRASVNYGGRA
jgi:hypothetical protein